MFAYEVDAAATAAFQAAYGPDGEWARFFRAGEALYRREASLARFTAVAS